MTRRRTTLATFTVPLPNPESIESLPILATLTILGAILDKACSTLRDTDPEHSDQLAATKSLARLAIKVASLPVASIPSKKHLRRVRQLQSQAFIAETDAVEQLFLLTILVVLQPTKLVTG